MEKNISKNYFKNNGHFILKNNFFDINDNNVIEFNNIFNDPDQKRHTNHKGKSA